MDTFKRPPGMATDFSQFQHKAFHSPRKTVSPAIFASFPPYMPLESGAMQCPFCQAPLYASAPECPACRLTYPRTSALVGAAPRLTPMVSDTTRSLSASDQARLKRRITAIHTRFPELTMEVVMHHFPEQHPFSMYVFWLFNAAAFDSEGGRGKDNHALLLAIDPARGEAAIMPGYGLEPFLNREALDHLLELAGPSWEGGHWADGILRVLNGLDQWLETIALPHVEAAPLSGEY